MSDCQLLQDDLSQLCDWIVARQVQLNSPKCIVNALPSLLALSTSWKSVVSWYVGICINSKLMCNVWVLCTCDIILCDCLSENLPSLHLPVVYIRECGDGVCDGKSLNKEEIRQIVGFRVAMICTCTHHVTNIPLQGLDRSALTVGALSGPHSQIGALLWCHFTSGVFTWLAKSIQGKQASRL